MTDHNDRPGRLKQFGTMPPPAELESRVISSLQKRGQLARSDRPTMRWLLRTAAAMALFAGGFATGMLAHRPAVDDTRPRYALLLYDGNRPGVDDVAEMREWVIDLRQRGHFVDGEKLDDVPIAGDPGLAAPAGFIIVSANSPEEAVAISRTMPHLRNGGKVVIRAIDRG
jgi:hypothetical protein